MHLILLHLWSPVVSCAACHCPWPQVMVEPMMLVDTGYSYEKAAITDWFNKGNKFCPRSGGLRCCQAYAVAGAAFVPWQLAP